MTASDKDLGVITALLERFERHRLPAALKLAFEHDADQANGSTTPRRFSIQPEDHNIQRTPLSVLEGGDAEENAGILRAIFAAMPDSIPAPIAALATTSTVSIR